MATCWPSTTDLEGPRDFGLGCFKQILKIILHLHVFLAGRLASLRGFPALLIGASFTGPVGVRAAAPDQLPSLSLGLPIRKALCLPGCPHGAHLTLTAAKQSKQHTAGEGQGWHGLTCLMLGEALIPPWDRMWPFRAGRLLNSFRQMEQVSLLLASIWSPNTAFGWPLLRGRDTRDTTRT